MNYQSQPDQTWRTSVSYIVIYISIKFDKIQFRVYLVIANYMDFKSIQGL